MGAESQLAPVWTHDALCLVLDILALEQGELPGRTALTQSSGRHRQPLGRVVPSRSFTRGTSAHWRGRTNGSQAARVHRLALSPLGARIRLGRKPDGEPVRAGPARALAAVQPMAGV